MWKKKQLKSIKNMWYLNNGCCNHMTRDKETFVDMDSSSFAFKVKIRNVEYLEVEDKDNIGVTTKQWAQVIHDVLYVW